MSICAQLLLSLLKERLGRCVYKGRQLVRAMLLRSLDSLTVSVKTVYDSSVFLSALTFAYNQLWSSFGLCTDEGDI